MTKKEIKAILQKHKKWLQDKEGGECANLTKADLINADLSNVDLRFADLKYANLRGANLIGANLRYTDLRGADLSCVDLKDADLHDAYLHGADLRGADLRYTDLTYVELCNTNLADAILDEKEKYRLGFIVKTPIKGWKKCKNEVIVELEIPSKAVVFCINGKKCRTNIAKVISITGANNESKEYAVSNYDIKFIYKVGETIETEDFDLVYNRECSTGIHFFLTKEEAEHY